MTFEHRLKWQECAAHTKSRDDHGSSFKSLPAKLRRKEAQTWDMSHLTYFTTPYLKQEAGDDGKGRGDKGQIM